MFGICWYWFNIYLECRYHFIYKCVAFFLFCVKKPRQESFVIKNRNSYNATLSISSILFIIKLFFAYFVVQNYVLLFSPKTILQNLHFLTKSGCPLLTSLTLNQLLSIKSLNKTLVIPSLRFKGENCSEKDCRKCFSLPVLCLHLPLKKDVNLVSLYLR